MKGIYNLYCCCFFLKVWVLDSTPGKVHAGGDGEDHPAELIDFLSRMPKQACFLVDLFSRVSILI